MPLPRYLRKSIPAPNHPPRPRRGALSPRPSPGAARAASRLGGHPPRPRCTGAHITSGLGGEGAHPASGKLFPRGFWRAGGGGNYFRGTLTSQEPLPRRSSLTSLAAFSPSSRRFLSIILLLSTAALSSALSVQPILGRGLWYRAGRREARERRGFAPGAAGEALRREGERVPPRSLSPSPPPSPETQRRRRHHTPRSPHTQASGEEENGAGAARGGLPEAVPRGTRRGKEAEGRRRRPRTGDRCRRPRGCRSRRRGPGAPAPPPPEALSRAPRPHGGAELGGGGRGRRGGERVRDGEGGAARRHCACARHRRAVARGGRGGREGTKA